MSWAFYVLEFLIIKIKYHNIRLHSNNHKKPDAEMYRVFCFVGFIKSLEPTARLKLSPTRTTFLKPFSLI